MHNGVTRGLRGKHCTGVKCNPHGIDIPFFVTRHSLVERKARYLFYCRFFLFVFCSVNDFSATRGPIHAKVCMPA